VLQGGVVGAGARRLSLGCDDAQRGRCGRAYGGAAVGPGARLSVGRLACAQAADGGHMEVLQWARANGCPWDGRTYAQMLATEAVDADAALRAAAAVDVMRGLAASMGVVVAVEASDTWNTASHCGFLFLLILLGRPLVLALVQILLVFLVCFLSAPPSASSTSTLPVAPCH